MLSALSVTNLHDSGSGSFRQALLDANANPGLDTINFSVAGIIQLTSGALPAVTSPVNIDGTTALNFAGSPKVEVDFNDFGGMVFDVAAANSALKSLSLVNASGNGVTVNGADGNLI
ncbi:MAG TPA: hypothetical protein VHV08_03770, partial [Pirellulales bacterium]|nr:hypothetical protein [Pirellulales bacterium]